MALPYICESVNYYVIFFTVWKLATDPHRNTQTYLFVIMVMIVEIVLRIWGTSGMFRDVHKKNRGHPLKGCQEKKHPLSKKNHFFLTVNGFVKRSNGVGPQQAIDMVIKRKNRGRIVIINYWTPWLNRPQLNKKQTGFTG